MRVLLCLTVGSDIVASVALATYFNNFHLRGTTHESKFGMDRDTFVRIGIFTF